MSDDIDGAAWAWEQIEAMAERWRETPEWHDPPFHDGRIHVTTAELHAAAILVYRKSLGFEGLALSPEAPKPGPGPTCWHCKKPWPCGCEHGERILATLVEVTGPRGKTKT